MLQKLNVQGIHCEVDENLQKYIDKRLGRMDKYLARRYRDDARTEVSLKESNGKGPKQCVCEVIMHLPQHTIRIAESTINMYAAIDIAEAKLKVQLQKYKDVHSSRLRRHLMARMPEQSI